MRERTLEDEFKTYVLIHKKAVLTGKLAAYYQTIQQAGVNIPFFMQECPIKRAEAEVNQLFSEDRETFENLYQEAWQQYAECFP